MFVVRGLDVDRSEQIVACRGEQLELVVLGAASFACESFAVVALRQKVLEERGPPAVVPRHTRVAERPKDRACIGLVHTAIGEREGRSRRILDVRLIEGDAHEIAVPRQVPDRSTFAARQVEVQTEKPDRAAHLRRPRARAGGVSATSRSTIDGGAVSPDA